MYGGAAAREVKESHKVFCLRHFENFFDSGNVEDKPRSGRPANISEEDAKEAGQLLMEGFWREVKVKGGGGRTEERLFYYTTFGDAVRNCDRLHELMVKYKCTERAMLDAIHRHCPDLVRRSMFAHHEFTVAELEARSAYGSYMLGLLNTVPNFLHLIVFMDESTFVLHGRSKHEVRVYCSKNDVRFNDVCYISDLDAKPLKVHFFLAVTANEAFQPTGVVLYDECTGTTGIWRYENKLLDGSTKVGDWKYQVSPWGSGHRV
jgi:hypothetical protein